jgi:hypothetical protein
VKARVTTVRRHGAASRCAVTELLLFLEIRESQFALQGPFAFEWLPLNGYLHITARLNVNGRFNVHGHVHVNEMTRCM